MDEYYCKRSGCQIPAFGNWDFANEMPITQYFESARQAGLIRYSSSSSGESDPYVRAADHHHHRDLYSVVDFNKHHHHQPPGSSTLRKATRNSRERRYPQHAMVTTNKETTTVNMTMMRKHGKVYDVTEHPRKQQQLAVQRSTPPRRAPKPVDEDLYKIPPELLRTTKRKKMLGFISKCLVPAAACVS